MLTFATSKQNDMKTFTQIKKGDHLSNNCIDLVVTSVSDKFINGYCLQVFRSTGEIKANSIYKESFDNKLIVANLQVSQPIERIASDEELNCWLGLKPTDMSTIKIL